VATWRVSAWLAPHVLHPPATLRVIAGRDGLDAELHSYFVAATATANHLGVYRFSATTFAIGVVTLDVIDVNSAPNSVEL